MLIRATIDAFALGPESAACLRAVRDDRLLAKARLEVHEGGIAAAIARYASHPTPQIVLVEEDLDDESLIQALDRLADVCEPGTRVIVAGRLNDIRLYRTLMARGVSEYLLSPLQPRAVLDAIAALFADPGAAPRGRLIAFWAARGGAGASTVAQNVAWEMARALGEDVIYTDLDLAFGTSVLAFNLEARQGAAELLAQPDRIDTVLLDRFLLAHDDHLKVLGSAADPRQAAAPTIDAVERLLEVAGRMGPAVILDLPHLWADWTEHVLALADEVVLVARPDLASLRDAKALLELLAPRRGEAAAPRLVLNAMDAYRKTQLSAKDFEETLGVKPALSLPFEPVLFGEAANNGQMLREAGRAHKLLDPLSAFALALSGRSPARKAKAGKASPWLGWLRK